MDQQELKNVLEMHRKWVAGESDGKHADLSSANLSSANLSYADLRSADLSYADLSSADLSYADLSSADLRYANLSYADLRYANLRYADLRYANLRYADLRYANLSYADLSSADLRYANLRSANLSSANLSSANLSSIKDDFFKRLALVKTEVIGLYDFLQRGKVNGEAYQGECACFVGSIANIRKENYQQLTCSLKPDSDSPTERWFLAIKQGDTPANNVISRVTAEWMEEFMKENELVAPKYKLISDIERPDLFAAVSP